MSKPERAIVIFGVMAIALVVMAVIASVLDAPWLMVLVPIAYLLLQWINRLGK